MLPQSVGEDLALRADGGEALAYTSAVGTTAQSYSFLNPNLNVNMETIKQSLLMDGAVGTVSSSHANQVTQIVTSAPWPTSNGSGALASHLHPSNAAQQQQPQQHQIIQQQPPQQSFQINTFGQQQQHQPANVIPTIVAPAPTQQLVFGSSFYATGHPTASQPQPQQQGHQHAHPQPQQQHFFNVQNVQSRQIYPTSVINLPQQLVSNIPIQTAGQVPVDNKRKANKIAPIQTVPTQHAAPEEDRSNTAVSASSSSGTSSGAVFHHETTSGLMHGQHSHNQVSAPNKRAKNKSGHMTAEERRRHERNVREQQRSHKISQQIKELRSVLTESKVPFKQNKFSILMSVVDYIKHLQNRATLLDSEHHKLVSTIRQTNDLVNSGFIHRSDPDDISNVGNDAEMLYVQGLDYRTIFEQCSIPFGVAALDGRFMMCNSKFESVTGLSKQSLETQTLFGLLSSSDVDEVFRALGTLLNDNLGLKTQKGNANGHGNENRGTVGKECDNSGGTTGEKNRAGTDDSNGYGNGESSSGDHDVSSGDSSGSTIVRGYWCGALSCPNENIQINITLTRTTNGVPKFFNCALSSPWRESTGSFDEYQ